MHNLLASLLVLANLSGHMYAHGQATPSLHDEHGADDRRTSLGFGPEHPHVIFQSNPYQINFAPLNPSTDPMEVARLMMKDVLADSMSSSPSYKIRDDSYTDKNTGVTRVYVRQLVNGLEVVDGDMNINIKDGTVLSYGNSFYTGSPPQKFTNPTISAVPALLEFMATFGGHSTAPDSSAEPTDAMKVIPVHRVVPDEISVEYTIDNVHGAVSPVKAKLAYAQVRNKAASDTELLLVWKFEVEMRNNSYEATVSASAPYKVISVVDRVASFRKG